MTTLFLAACIALALLLCLCPLPAPRKAEIPVDGANVRPRRSSHDST